MGIGAKGPSGGPCSSRRGRVGAFAEFLGRAGRQPELAAALGLGYAELEPEERRLLVPLVAEDAQRQGGDPGSILATLLAAETDPELAGLIADTMCRLPPLAEAGEAPTLRTWLEGDLEAGRAILVQRLHGALGEALWLRWTREGLDAGHEPLLPWTAGNHPPPGLAVDPMPPKADPQITIDTLAAVLWRHRRAGHRWPTVLGRFADLFAPRARCRSAFVGGQGGPAEGRPTPAR